TPGDRRGRPPGGPARHYRPDRPVGGGWTGPTGGRRRIAEERMTSPPDAVEPSGRMPPTDLAMRCQAIRLLVLDVDGVLTDGRITYTNDGVEIKSFHVRDGSGLVLWQRAGRQVAIISGRTSRAVEVRAAELGIKLLYQGQADKRQALRDLLT